MLVNDGEEANLALKIMYRGRNAMILIIQIYRTELNSVDAAWGDLEFH